MTTHSVIDGATNAGGRTGPSLIAWRPWVSSTRRMSGRPIAHERISASFIATVSAAATRRGR